METIKLDLIPGKKMPSLHASQFDDGRAYHIDLTENRVPYVLDGTETISVIVRKCDNTLVSMDIANTFGNKSYLEFEVTEQMTACAGFNYGEIILEKNGDRLGSLNFYLQVETAPDENGITSQSEIKNLARQVHDIVVEELADNGAGETGYDNTESGLEATNVQDAIDEVNTKINNIPSVDAYTKEQSDEKYATKTELSEKASIDDSEASASKTYSSDKVTTLLNGKVDVGTVASIDDSATSSGSVWSSEKVNTIANDIKSGGLNDNSIAIKKTKFLRAKIDNLHNTATDVDGSWFTLNNGKVILQSNQYTTTYTAVTILLPDENITKLTFSSTYTYAYVRDIYFSAELVLPATVISSLQPKKYINTPYTIDIPQGTKVLYIAFQNIQNQDVMVNAGDTALPFEPYSVKYLLDGKEIAFAEDSSSLFEFPDELYSVVGDTLELFYKGITKTVDSDLLEFDVNASEGKAYKRKYVVTPTTAGTIPLTLIARDNFGNQLNAKEIDLIKVATPTSPNTLKNVLCIGDSLTLLGTWCAELDRRLTGSGGSPSGLGLSNIDFVGTMSNGSTGYEGRGGWSFKSYSTSMSSDEFMLINGTFDKTSADQHSIYKDSNNKQWKLETITANQIKIIRVSASGTLPSSGILTWVSGGVNTGNIVYTSSEQAAGNPFWNDNISDIDFVTYASNLGISSIDYAIILLGWNSTGVEQAIYKSQAETFISKLHRDYPNCRVILLGLQTPSRDGLAVNYGTDWKYFATMQKAWIINNIYKSIADDTTNVYYVNLASQFDAEYGYPTTNMNVNVRSAETEEIQSNGIHPNNSGQYQIADAVYRRICALLGT